MKQRHILIFLFLFLIACRQVTDSTIPAEEPIKKLSASDFTPIEAIDPSVYFATPENIANDPNDALMDVFRNKKAADIADPKKPRPLPASDIGQIENISHLQDWEDASDIFQFDWSQIPLLSKMAFSLGVRVRTIFNNKDLKVRELAIANGYGLPLHAEATPSVYLVLGGEGIATSGSKTAEVHVGTSVGFDSYETKKITANGKEPLKILWFSWAPKGDPSYLESGYYLTGSNPHIQSINGILPDEFEFWDSKKAKSYQLMDSEDSDNEPSYYVKSQRQLLASMDSTNFYPSLDHFTSASDIEWVDVMNMDPKSFFFAKDLKSLGSTLEMMSRFAKIKSVFRAHRPDSGYDLNYSYLAWGPQSKYITHSHAICEFYYVLEGDVEYIIEGNKYHAVPGNFYFHPPYYDHEMRGLKKDLPFLSISGTWVPFGRRELFDKPFLLLEDIQSSGTIGFLSDFDFHDFGMKKGLSYGEFLF